MAELTYYDRESYTDSTDIFAALAAIPDFWDEKTAATLVKEDLTLTLSDGALSITGYNKSIVAVQLNGRTCDIIAATSTGLVFNASGSGNFNAFALGCDKNGDWGACSGSDSATGATISYLIADNLTSNTFSGGAVNVSSTNTQIVEIAADKGNYIFDELRRVLYTPSSVKGYNGKLTMPNGEKYIKVGPFVLLYTEVE